ERPVVLQVHALAALVEELRLALCYRPQRREGVGALVSQRRQAQQLLALGALRQGVGVVALFRMALNGQKERFAALEFFRCGAGGVLLRERVFRRQRPRELNEVRGLRRGRRAEQSNGRAPEQEGEDAGSRPEGNR